MNELNLKCIKTKKAKKIIGTNYKNFPSCNKFQQIFTQAALCCNGFGFKNDYMSHKVSTQNNDALTISTLKTEYELRGNSNTVTFHSNQESNYTASQNRNLLHSLKIEQSFSKKGTPYDNAVIESFFSQMKQENLNSKAFEFSDKLRDAVRNYIAYYNNYRPHKTLNYKTLQDYEKEYHKTKKKSELTFLLS